MKIREKIRDQLIHSSSSSWPKGVVSLFVLTFIVLLVLVTLDVPNALAGQEKLTMIGTSSGTDHAGTFFPAGTVFTNEPTVVTVYYDDAKGVPDYGIWPSCTNGIMASGVNDMPVYDSTLDINGKKWVTGALGFDTIFADYASTSNATSPKMSFGARQRLQFAGSTDLTGWDSAIFGGVSLNSINICRRWYDTFPPTGASPYSLSGTDAGSNNVSTDVALVGVPGNIAYFTIPSFTIASVAVDPVTPPLLVIPLPQNFGQPRTCTNQNSALSTNCATTPLTGGINAAVGNVNMSETDFSGGAATHLAFQRFYNSFDVTTTTGFGAGWISNYHRGLAITSTAIVVTGLDGARNEFVLVSTNWVPQANVTATLITTTGGYKVTWPNDMAENYNGSGQLTSIVERNGLTTSLSYTSSGLASVTGPFGHILTFTYNANNRVATMVLPDGTSTYTYGYDLNGSLYFVKNPDGKTHHYAHGKWPFTSLITQILDGNAVFYKTWDYDNTGRAVSYESAAGVDKITLAYTSTSSVDSTDANGNTHTYALTTNFGLFQTTSVTGVPDPATGSGSFTYDGNGFLASSTDYNGNVTTYTHNAKGEETSRTEAYGTLLARTTTTQWHATFHLPTEIDEPLGKTTTFGYDANGNVTIVGVTDGVTNRTWTYTYNGNSQRTSATDALGHTTTMDYDGSGNVLRVTNALGQTTTFNTYDANGRVTRMTDAVGLTTTFVYDKEGRLLSRKAGGLSFTTSYDNNGQAVRQNYPDGSYLLYAYDDANRLFQIKNTVNDQIVYTYDDNSNLTLVQALSSTNTVYTTHSYGYDAQNRMITSVGASLAETTTYTYDNQGNLLTTEDPNGHFMQYTYDALNRQSTIEDPYSGITTYGYDDLDHIVTISDPLGLTTTYTYTPLGDLTQLQSPDTGTAKYAYNTGGLLLTTTDSRGISTSYGYDALNRTTTVTYTGGVQVSYLYDTTTFGAGHMTGMTDPAGSASWTYDQFGNVVTHTQVANALTKTTTYTYDGSKRLSAIKYPSGKSVNYFYDTSGRLNSVAPVSTVAYFPMGPAKSWSVGNSSNFARTFDLDGRITGTKLSSTTTNVQTITYDNVGNITALSETGTAGNKTYGYDSFDRLSSFFNGTTTTSYSYDANSNRTSITLGTTTTYAYPGTSNRISSIGGTTTYGYDNSGNVTNDGANTWSYDVRGRMATLTAATTTAAFGYNGFGQRITKKGSSVPTGTNTFVYDEMGNLLGEYNSSGTNISENVWLPDTPMPVLSKGFGIAGFGPAIPIAQQTGSTGATIGYITPDWLGSPHIITNSSRQYQWTWDHYAFGDNAPNQNPAGLGAWTYNLRFPGQYKDIESNTNYNMFRDNYNPATGRYNQSDPIGLGGGINTYGYANANPITKIDARGLAEQIATPMNGTDPLDPKQLNRPLTPLELQEIDATIAAIGAGTEYGHPYMNFPDKVTGAQMPAGPAYRSYDLIIFCDGKPIKPKLRGPERIYINSLGQVFYSFNHGMSYYHVRL